MDSSAEEIEFDKAGICNFCKDWDKNEAIRLKEKENLPKIVEQIKKDGQGKKYDCLLGLSGGVDSSYTLHLLVELGLRPLTFTINNGWESKEAEENIMRLVEGLKVPFYRYVIDNEHFKDIQWAFIKGGIKNLETLTDHILWAATYEMCVKYGIKWIISGGNHATEGIMPKSFGEDPRDLYWIKSVYRKVTGKKLTHIPMLPLWKEQYYRLIKGIKKVNLLDYF